ncbi:hypothetical protein [Pseudomonas asplenii]|uniref:hypothetical protein n=1 Tax=Pseudomonas asplenii TaxID=53407 RepID=UPI00128EA998|nr:hypothetical protein [Pseudomonas fuscovaginae]
MLSCNLQAATVSVLARQLDTPSNLCPVPGAVIVCAGMGLSGRSLPMPDQGNAPLTGRLRRIPLDPS